MCGPIFSFPIFRHGTACEILDPSGKKYNVTDEESKEIAMNLKEVIGLELNKIAEDFSNSNKVVMKIKSNGTSFDSNEGFIVNFDTILLTFEEYIAQLKISITVCMGDNRSKVWCRLSLLKYQEEKAIGLSQEIVDDYYNHCVKYSTSIGDRIADKYLDFLVAPLRRPSARLHCHKI